MSQKITSVYKLVTIPFVYELIQSALGQKKFRKQLCSGPLQTRPGDRVLDVGCGPATLLPLLGGVDYLGMDLNPAHIEKAKANYRDKGRFICGNAVTEIEKAPGPFDLILCIGLLHHLDDDEAAELINALSKRLSAEGRLVTCDPVYLEKQNFIARTLKDLDSGQNIRTPNGYAERFSTSGLPLKTEVRSGLLNVPYNHCCNMLEQRAA